MARTIKKGLEYFPLDVDFFQDIRIRKLIKYQGGKAITVYALLLCNIYRNGYYVKWDKELPFILSEQTGYTEVYIQEAIDCCMNIGLLSKELFESDKVLTSKGIQERYRRICTSSRRGDEIHEFNLLSVERKKSSSAPKSPDSTSTQPLDPKLPKNDTKVKATPKAGPKPKPVTDTTVEPPSPAPAPPVPPKYEATIEDEVAEMKRSPQWKEAVCAQYAIDMAKLDFFLSDFALKRHKPHTSLQDAKSNFCYWLQKQLTKGKNQQQPQAQTKPQPPNADPYEFKGGFGGVDN
ncbi:MAG: DUF4373 domain-containing protein [Bacteroides sp.]|nr:DUF4373 domain-containing protein [Bacteroides sp.]